MRPYVIEEKSTGSRVVINSAREFDRFFENRNPRNWRIVDPEELDDEVGRSDRFLAGWFILPAVILGSVALYFLIAGLLW